MQVKLNSLEKFKEIAYSMKKNRRPSIHGKALKKNKFTDFTITDDFINLDENDELVKSVLTKNNGEIRDNVYLTSPQVLTMINYIAFKHYLDFGLRDNVYFSGDFDNKFFFYSKSYSDFHKELMAYSKSYSHFIKIDIKDFFTSIDLEYFSFGDKYQTLFYKLLVNLGFDKMPIFLDCAGLSYFSTQVYLTEFDQMLEELFVDSFRHYTTIRYSDDLYVFFDSTVNYCDSNMLYKLKDDIRNIANRNNLTINEQKFECNLCDQILDSVDTKLYDYFVNHEDFDIHEILGTIDEIREKVKEFLNELVNIRTQDEYNKLINSKFTLKIGPQQRLRKNVLNEILYDKRLSQVFNDDEVQKIIRKNRYYENIKFDPVRLTRLILRTKEPYTIRQLLFNLYISMESGTFGYVERIMLETYIAQRAVSEVSQTKIKSKLGDEFKEFSSYLDKYIWKN